MKRVAVGVIGTGFWGENQVRVLRQSRVADLVAICDADKKRAKEMGTKYSVPWYSDLSKFLRVPKLEAVTVCTPTQTHLKVGLLAIEAGKNLLVEKPMTGEEKSAEKLVYLARKAGVKLLVGFIERFNPGVKAVKKMLKEGTVGDVIIATGRRVARWPIRIGDVGVVKDTAIHDIDAMRYLLEEEVAAVFAQTGSLRTHSYEDYAEISSDATISLDYITQEITLENSQRLVKPYTPWAEPLKLELENFLKTIIRDATEAPSGEDALRAIRICDAALRSGKSKTLVTLNAN